MRHVLIIGILSFFFLSCASVDTPELETHEKAQQELDVLMDSIFDFPATNRNCLACHQGIMPARSHQSEMMQTISKRGEKYGDPNGCIVCHGGNPMEEKDVQLAHGASPKGNAQSFFTPTPGGLQVNENTCGLCHVDHVYNAHRSIMNTDAGKAKYITWSWGIGIENKNHEYGNYAITDPDGDTPRFGTEVYKEYMKELAELHPGQFPKELKQIPEVDIETLSTMPEQAAFTYLRRCNSCHISNSGGGYRGLGCAACHSLSSKSRYYEGKDSTLIKSARGRIMVHGMLGSGKSKVKVNDKEISGIQVSTCATCHSSGRRIGSAYQGFMGKYLKNDVHHRIEKDGKMVTGLLCQDCHTSNSMHGNGNIGSTTLATVEVECADCHGTPESYPWELALAYGEEFGRDITDRPARGLAQRPMPITERFGTVYDKEKGYLLTSRGNPFGNVVRTENGVKIHSATGNVFNVPLLKDITKNDSYKNPVEAKTAMVAVRKHMESLECYACHSAWAGQYYGNQYTIDYKSKSIDWVASSKFDSLQGTSLENKGKYIYQAGQRSSGSYSYERWETPPLGINGEGRVAPLTAIIQTIGTVVDANGKTVLSKSAPKRTSGEHTMEMSPLHPHTNSLEARKCQDCHGSDLAMGYGVDGGRFKIDPSIERYADIVDADGENVSKYTRPQIAAIASLKGAFDQILEKGGKQRLTVGSHWEDSGPLTKDQLHKLSRSGTCAACHQDVPMGSIPISMLKQIAKVADLSFNSEESHSSLLMQNNILMAWIKVVGIILAIPLLIVGTWYFFYKRQR